MRYLRLEIAAWATWWRAPAKHKPIIRPNDYWPVAGLIVAAEFAIWLWAAGGIRPLG